MRATLAEPFSVIRRTLARLPATIVPHRCEIWSDMAVGKLKELKVVYACNECGYSETRNAEPMNIDRGEGAE